MKIHQMKKQAEFWKHNTGIAKWLMFGFCTMLWLVLTPMSAYAAPRTVNITLTDHGFSPNSVLAALNKPIQVHVVNRGQHTHQFSIPYYRIYSSDLGPGAATNIGFSPWTEGKFKMISDPSGQDKPEFTGQFIVLEGK
jgi:Cupredoxin-like domain